MRVVGISLVALGIASVGVGGYMGLRARSTYDDSNEGGSCLPNNACDATGKSLRADANTLAIGSTIAFGAGAAALVGGAILWLMAPRTSTVGLLVAPVISAQEGGVLLQRRF